MKDRIPKETLKAAWAIALAAIAPMLDSTMINMAVGELNQDFHTTLDVVQWAITGYALALAISVPISGWLMNQYNGKKVFITAVACFGITSVLAGISWNIESFIFFRLLQGATAGIITPLMSTLLVKTAGPKNLGKVMAIVSTPMILGPILGPVLGGFIIQLASWHWIFYINVLVVLIAIPLMHKTLPDFKPFNQASKLDLTGIILLSLLSGAFIYGITKAASHQTFLNSETYFWMFIGLAATLAYVWHNYRTNNRTVVPLVLFRYKQFAASSVGLFLANMAIMGPMFLLPLFFQNLRGMSAIQAALALAPQGIGMLITRPFIGKMIDQIGAKYVVLISLVLSILGTLPLIFVTANTSMVFISIVLFIRGMSVGGINLPLMSDAYTGLSDEQIPEASIGVNIIENVGSSFGTAIIATVVAAAMQNTVASTTHFSGYQAGFLVSAITLAFIFLPGLFLTNKRYIK
ncbi:MDR family MFS transporter [Listeria fleischmannii]|uniref:MDR family MFS transporter n=1 Tax=Listeria fleischmannii TaxID=1069827 RepID=UPI0016291482|nr:MDR family MFS transporter [Listeria fleischmannii]MBC1418687.1 multidrug efflux MFS transporter [Listeria fleischmannii]